MVVLIVLGVGLLVGLGLVLRARPHEVGVPSAGSSTTVAAGPWVPVASTPSTGSAGSVSADPGPSVVVVHVAGLVHRPGVVTLSPGARVADAVAAAGGVSDPGDPGTVNLARPVLDGEQIVVRESGAPPPSGGSGAGPTAGPLDLNTADQQALEALPGVGPVLAGRILEWRTKHGRFSSVEELREVAGIGEKVFAALADQVRV